MMSCLQMGQTRLCANHRSTHAAWYRWKHGNTRSSSPSWNSSQHIVQLRASPLVSSLASSEAALARCTTVAVALSTVAEAAPGAAKPAGLSFALRLSTRLPSESLDEERVVEAMRVPAAPMPGAGAGRCGGDTRDGTKGGRGMLTGRPPLPAPSPRASCHRRFNLGNIEGFGSSSSPPNSATGLGTFCCGATLPAAFVPRLASVAPRAALRPRARRFGFGLATERIAGAGAAPDARSRRCCRS
mmetsp:Transcript_3745/g.9718  ORF Transcript_3745/g.9718 Transcript_3745/m.9718 type:complete len:243 (-) Transcript_3745:1073-1801(-)